jgi:hypothetical protein
MLFFIGDGRLGNQVFQLLAIRACFGEERLWTPNLRSLEKVFNTPAGTRILPIPRTAEKILRRSVGPFCLRPLFKWLRLGTYCHEPMAQMLNGSHDPGGLMARQRGMLPMAFIDGGFYQNLTDLLAPSDFRRLTLRDDVLIEASQVVTKAMSGKAWPSAVMHVRRGDYVGYSAYGLNDVLLPVTYFQKAAAAARESLGSDAEILVVTDDSAWCEEALAALQPFTVVSGSEAVDFALLSMFPVAILSNSTFSLAAACIGPDVKRVIGPRFWFGHSVNQWYPPLIQAKDSRFTYV